MNPISISSNFCAPVVPVACIAVPVCPYGIAIYNHHGFGPTYNILHIIFLHIIHLHKITWLQSLWLLAMLCFIKSCDKSFSTSEKNKLKLKFYQDIKT